MAYTLELSSTTFSGTSNVYVFAFTPLYQPSFRPRYNASEPPAVVACDERWDLEEIYLLHNSSSDLITDFNLLRAAVQSRSAPITGAVFKKDGSAVHTMSTSTHKGFMLSALDVIPDPANWVNHVKLKLILEATLQNVNSSGSSSGDSQESTVSELTQELEFQYDERGFLRKSLRGTLRVLNGGVEAIARTFRLTLPDDTYQYITKGPEGVNVKILDFPTRNKASFESTIQQTGLSIPVGVNSYFVNITQEMKSGYTVFQKEISAQSSTVGAALDQIMSEVVPDNLIGFVVSYSSAEGTARGVFRYVSFDKEHGYFDIRYALTVRTGGEGIQGIEVPGFDSVMVRTSKKSQTVVEDLSVSAFGKQFTRNSKLDPENQDPSESESSYEYAPDEYNATQATVKIISKSRTIWRYSSGDKIASDQYFKEITNLLGVG